MKKPRLEKPSYSVKSVDNALRLIQLLRDLGSVQLTEAAQELGVAVSTAHRLLSVLVYRGFAVQDESRRYLPGPALDAPPADLSWSRQLLELAQPHLERLSAALDETTNLKVRVGTKVRFIGCVEGTNVLRVSDRRGAVLSAHLTSGGKAMLAELDTKALATLYRPAERGGAGDPGDPGDTEGPAGAGEHGTDAGLDEDAFQSLVKELAAIRTSGYAINLDASETGVSAVGTAVHNGAGQAIAALSVAIPTARYHAAVNGPLIPTLLATREALDREIADSEPHWAAHRP